MNEEQLRDIIKGKLAFAEVIIEHLPESLAEEAEKMKRVMLETMSEAYEKEKAKPPREKKTENAMKKVDIE